MAARPGRQESPMTEPAQQPQPGGGYTLEAHVTNLHYHGAVYGLDPGFAPGEPSPEPHHCGPALPIEWEPFGHGPLEPPGPWGLPVHLPWEMPWDMHHEQPVAIGL